MHFSRGLVSVSAAIAMIAGGLYLCERASALIGGEPIGDDDIFARSMVNVSLGGGAGCSGEVYGDRYVLTNAHCFVDHDRQAIKYKPKDIEIRYGIDPLHPKATRRVTKFLIHEQYLVEVRFLRRQSSVLDDPSKYLRVANYMDDIAVLQVAGEHPPEALSVVFPKIDDDFLVGWNEIRYNLYGYGAVSDKSPQILTKLLTWRQDAPGQNIGRPPEVDNSKTIDLIGSIHPDFKSRGTCYGDSGGAGFLYDVRQYGEDKGQRPFLRDGHPILMGLIFGGNGAVDPRHMHATIFNNKETSSPEATINKNCGNWTILLRTDWYHDWIPAAIKRLQ